MVATLNLLSIEKEKNMNSIPCIPLSEFKERVKKVQELMRKDGFDFILSYGNEAEPQYVRYFQTIGRRLKRQACLSPARGSRSF